LNDENIYPDEKLLQTVLADSYYAYCSLLELIRNQEITYEWRYYRDGKAWLCKVQKKKRTIIWMSAWKGFMKATIYFPQKYVDRVYQSNISEAMKQKIRNTKDVGKSKPCLFELRNNQIPEDLEKL
jgi:hypothetical protein